MSTATARQPLVEAGESALSRPIGDDGFEIEALPHLEALKGFALRLTRGDVAAAPSKWVRAGSRSNQARRPHSH